jgi:class 3 adenylate cyclase
MCMSVTVETVVSIAKQLPPEDQAALLSSLYELVAPMHKEWEGAWDRECHDRLSAYWAGAIDAVDSVQAMQELRRKHGLE